MVNERSTVYSLLFIDILQTVVITWSTWDFAIAPWGDLDALFHPPPHIVTVPMFSSIGGCTGSRPPTKVHFSFCSGHHSANILCMVRSIIIVSLA